VVLDPFMGSGQTAIAAVKTGRYYVGYEINEEYVRLAESRIRACSRPSYSLKALRSDPISFWPS